MLEKMKSFITKKFFAPKFYNIYDMREDAKNRLNHDKYCFLNEEAKTYILDNIKDFIIQDPNIERVPCVIFFKKGSFHRENIRRILGISNTHIYNTFTGKH